MTIWQRLAAAAGATPLKGPLDALFGASGAAASVPAAADRRADHQQVAFTIGFIALCAKLAKADGVVVADEISAFTELFKVAPEEADHVARFFNLAKQDSAGYEAYADQMAQLLKDNRPLLQDVLEALCHIAAADGVLHPAEAEFLANVARRFGIAETEFRHIRARFIPSDRGSPYEVLGVEPAADNDELRRQYRKLVAENHPDRAIARGVPNEFVVLANQKLAAINEAYAEIRKERGF